MITSFIDTIQQYYLQQHVLQPTRNRPGEIAVLLDLIFTNEEGTRTIYDRSRYNVVKNELQALRRKLRAHFETNVAYNIDIKPKPFWSYVKSKMKTRGKLLDGTKVTEAKNKAERPNVFFSSVYT